jgi:hypothetical protein
LSCDACKRQIGLRSAWHAHPALSVPGASGTSGYRTQTFQKLYVCSSCRTVLVRGRNTGWAVADPTVLPAVIPDVPSPA